MFKNLCFYVLLLISSRLAFGSEIELTEFLKINNKKVTYSELKNEISEDKKVEKKINDLVNFDIKLFLKYGNKNSVVTRAEIENFKSAFIVNEFMSSKNNLGRVPSICTSNGNVVLSSVDNNFAPDVSYVDLLSEAWAFAQPYTAAASAISGIFQARKENRAHEEQMEYLKKIDMKIDEVLNLQKLTLMKLNTLVSDIRDVVISENLDKEISSINAGIDRFYGGVLNRKCITDEEWIGLHTSLSYINEKEDRPSKFAMLIKQFEFAIMNSNTGSKQQILRKQVTERTIKVTEQINELKNNAKNESKKLILEMSEPINQKIKINNFEIDLPLKYHHNFNSELKDFSKLSISLTLPPLDSLTRNKIANKCSEDAQNICVNFRDNNDRCVLSRIKSCTSKTEDQYNNLTKGSFSPPEFIVNQVKKISDDVNSMNDLNSFRIEFEKLSNFSPPLANEGKACSGKVGESNLFKIEHSN